MTKLIQPQTFSLNNAELYYFESLFENSVAMQWYQTLYQELNWRQEELVVYGQAHLIPRMQALYGEPGLSYQYSKQRFSITPWTQNLLQLKHCIEQASGAKFNCVLANLYRSGQDCMGWHADNEAELGHNPVIASLSLGAKRSFKLKHRLTNEVFSLELESGSLLIMAGTTQEFWYHSLPKRARIDQGRINLTFRYLHS